MPTPRTRRTNAAPAASTDTPGDDGIIEPTDWRQQVGTVHQLVTTDEPEDIEPLTAADRVAAMLADVADDARAKLKLYRLDKDSRMVWCDDMTPEQFEQGGLPAIRNRWGAGEYVLALYGTTPGKGGSPNGFGLITRQTVSIAPDLSAPADTPAAHSGLSQVLATIAEGQRAMLEALTRRPEQADPLAQMGVMLTLMTQMRQAMGDGGSREKPRGVLDLLGELKALKELGAELIGDKPAEPADPLTAMLPEVIQLVKAATSGPAAAPVAALPAVALPASMAGAPETLPTPGEPMPEINDPQQLVAQLQKHLRNLVKLAAANVDTELGADIVYDNLPDELIDSMRGEQWFQMLATFEPAVTPHREWFDKVRAQVLEWFDNGHPDDIEEASGSEAAS